jgi:DNA replication protein DnaC
MSELPARLTALGLRHVAENLDDLVALAQKRRMGARDLLEHLVDLEEKDRARRSLERRTTRSRIGRFKSIADYDWNWPTRIDRPRVEAAFQLDFFADHRNVVLVAPQGLGKTMIAQNIAHQAVVAGHSVLFLTAAQMLLDLGAQESARSLDRRLRFYEPAPIAWTVFLRCSQFFAIH